MRLACWILLLCFGLLAHAEGELERLAQADFYARLGVARDASPARIEAALKAKRESASQAPGALALYEQAGRVLLDSVQKAQYDGTATIRAVASPSKQKDYYVRLGLVDTATRLQVVQAYETLAPQFSDPADALALKEAFAVLSHPAIRQAHDRQRKRSDQGIEDENRMYRFLGMTANPTAEDFYQRVGAPRGIGQGTLMRLFDSHLIQNASNPAAVDALLQARWELSTPDLRTQYDALQTRQAKAKQDMQRSFEAGDTAAFLSQTRLKVERAKSPQLTQEYFDKLALLSERVLANPGSEQATQWVRSIQRIRAGQEQDDSEFSTRFTEYNLSLAKQLERVAQTEPDRAQSRKLFAGSPDSDALLDVWRESDRAVQAAAAAKAIAQNPLLNQIKSLQTQLNQTQWEEGELIPGLLEDPEQPGRIMPLKLLGASALGFWSSMVLTPVRSQVLELASHNGYAATGLALSAAMAGIYSLGVLPDVPTLVKRGLLVGRLREAERQAQTQPELLPHLPERDCPLSLGLLLRARAK